MKKPSFFQKTFLLADSSLKIVSNMLFIILSNADIKFCWKKLIWKFYITDAALSTIKQMKIIDKQKFAKTALDKNVKAFLIYIISFNLNLIFIHLVQKILIALLIAKKIKFLTKYSNF